MPLNFHQGHQGTYVSETQVLDSHDRDGATIPDRGHHLGRGGFTQKITKQYIWRITIGERSVGYRRSMGRDAWPSRREGTAELSLNSA